MVRMVTRRPGILKQGTLTTTDTDMIENTVTKLRGPYMKQPASRNLLYGSGNSNRDSVSTYGVGWRGRWEAASKGRGYMADSC